MNDTKTGEGTERLEQEGAPVRDTGGTEGAEKKEGSGSEAISGETGQIVFTVDDLPEEIKNLLDYENWTDNTQAVSRTEEDIKNSGMPEEFQQIINGDFSCVQGLGSEEGRKEMKEEYERKAGPL